MEQYTDVPTLEVEGFTPFAQIPRWILRAGSDLSHGAVRLYGALMTYADNDTRAAFPSRETLGSDLGVKARAVSGYIKELEEYGALKVTRRRNKRTGNFYANHYVLVFQPPSAEKRTRRDAENHPITRPTVVTTPTSSFTSNPGGSDTHVARPRSAQTSTPSNPGNLSDEQRSILREKLRRVGIEISLGHSFYSPEVSPLWESFTVALEDHASHVPGMDQLIGDMDNGAWTVGAKEADPYEAGVKLNKIIWAAMNM